MASVLVLPSLDAAGEVGAGACVGGEADDRDAPEGGVGLAVAAAVEPVTVWSCRCWPGSGWRRSRAAKAASCAAGAGLSPAVISNVEAVSGPTPLRGDQLGCDVRW